MGRVYVFGDEGGDLTFRSKPACSRYFIIGTATMGHCKAGQDLLDLRRELAWEGKHLELFHASVDKQLVRDRVFELLAASDVRVDATILDKQKTYDRIRVNPLYFYKLAWWMHFKYVAPRVCQRQDDLFVVASSLQINRKKQAVKQAVAEVVQQASPTPRYHAAFFSSVSDPCLQIADYATWAIQRKWEMGDDRSYKIIEAKVKSHFEPYLGSPIVPY